MVHDTKPWLKDSKNWNPLVYHDLFTVRLHCFGHPHFWSNPADDMRRIGVLYHLISTVSFCIHQLLRRLDLICLQNHSSSWLYMIILTHVAPKSVHSILLSPFVGDIAFPFDMTWYDPRQWALCLYEEGGGLRGTGVPVATPKRIPKIVGHHFSIFLEVTLILECHLIGNWWGFNSKARRSNALNFMVQIRP